ncbi:MAG: hypothetical protein JO053_15210 [Acidobacteria bacterium]|nr:hypothetical protein [Acidobacteriota bacterium]
MRGLGFAGLGLALIGASLWIIGWVIFNWILPEMGGKIRYFAMACNVLGVLAGYLATGLVSIGLVVGGKKAAIPPTV